MKVLRRVYGPFLAHLCTLAAGESMPRPLSEGRRRAEYTNAFAVVSGWVDCHGPAAGWRMEAGQADDELPDYPAGGAYRFTAGREGARFFCIGRFPPGVPFIRKRLAAAAGAGIHVPAGSIAAVYAGAIEQLAAPCIVDATAGGKDVRTERDSKLLLMRLG